MGENRTLALVLIPALFLFSSSRTPSQDRSIGEIVVTGVTTLNGQRAVSGSTIFNNQEIETRERSGAVVTLRDKGGSLTVEASSRVRVSRPDGKIMVELSQGSVALRPLELPATVNTPHLRIEVERDGAYRVAIAGQGTEVEAMAKSAVVKDGLREVIIHAGEAYASWEGQVAKREEKKKKRRRIIIPILIFGPLSVGLALAFARGEDTLPVSPVLPRFQ